MASVVSVKKQTIALHTNAPLESRNRHGIVDPACLPQTPKPSQAPTGSKAHVVQKASRGLKQSVTPKPSATSKPPATAKPVLEVRTPAAAIVGNPPAGGKIPFTTRPLGVAKPQTSSTMPVAASTDVSVKPSAVKPSVVKPSVVKPSVVKPSIVKPSVVKPSIVKPSVAQPSAAQPSAVRPSVAQPSVAKPSAVRPSVVKPSAVPLLTPNQAATTAKQPLSLLVTQTDAINASAKEKLHTTTKLPTTAKPSLVGTTIGKPVALVEVTTAAKPFQTPKPVAVTTAAKAFQTPKPAVHVNPSALIKPSNEMCPNATTRTTSVVVKAPVAKPPVISKVPPSVASKLQPLPGQHAASVRISPLVVGKLPPVKTPGKAATSATPTSMIAAAGASIKPTPASSKPTPASSETTIEDTGAINPVTGVNKRKPTISSLSSVSPQVAEPTDKRMRTSTVPVTSTLACKSSLIDVANYPKVESKYRRCSIVDAHMSPVPAVAIHPATAVPVSPTRKIRMKMSADVVAPVPVPTHAMSTVTTKVPSPARRMLALPPSVPVRAPAVAPPAPPPLPPASNLVPIHWTDEQQYVMHLVEQNMKNIFITAPAGAGKSTLLREIVRRKRQKSDAVAVCSTTGIAAVLLGGRTLHSFFGIGKGEEPVGVYIKTLEGQRYKKDSAGWRVVHTQVLIIDEISMCSKELWDKLDQICRHVRHHENVPFGGMRLYVFGDFKQLKPVENKPAPVRYAPGARGRHRFVQSGRRNRQRDEDDEDERDEKNNQQMLPLFKSESWIRTITQVVYLTKVFRQANRATVELMSRARLGAAFMTNDDRRTLEARRMPRPQFNEMCKRKMAEDPCWVAPTYLHPWRKNVNEFNDFRMKALVTPLHTYRTRIVHMEKATEDANSATLHNSEHQPVQAAPSTATFDETVMYENGQFTREAYLVEDSREVMDICGQLLKRDGMPVEDPVNLKEGAQVMLVVNLRVDMGLANGTRGRVIHIGPTLPGQSKEEDAKQKGIQARLYGNNTQTHTNMGDGAPTQLDYYNILGVECTAGPDEIQQSFVRLRMQLHPAKHRMDPLAKENFDNLLRARDTLMDVTRRDEYDRVMERSAMAVLWTATADGADATASATATDDSSMTKSDTTDEKVVSTANLPTMIWVKFQGVEDVIPISPHAWEVPVLNEDLYRDKIHWRRKIVAVQYPLIPCWAITVHKAQGQGLKSAYLYLGRLILHWGVEQAAGMAYVELSRIENLDELYIEEFDPKVFVTDQMAHAFEEEIIKVNRAEMKVFRVEYGLLDTDAKTTITVADAADDDAQPVAATKQTSDETDPIDFTSEKPTAAVSADDAMDMPSTDIADSDAVTKSDDAEPVALPNDESEAVSVPADHKSDDVTDDATYLELNQTPAVSSAERRAQIIANVVQRVAPQYMSTTRAADGSSRVLESPVSYSDDDGEMIPSDVEIDDDAVPPPSANVETDIEVLPDDDNSDMNAL